MTLHARNGKTIRNRPICSNFYRHGACLHPGRGTVCRAAGPDRLLPGGRRPALRYRALGTALVTDVQEHGGVITHTVSAALPVGQTVEGRIDWARRRDHMEQHTGEHILSGTLHRLFGAENVGFHIGFPAVRMDMSVPLTAGQLAEEEAPGQRGDPCGRPGALLVPRAGRPCKTDLPQQKGN